MKNLLRSLVTAFAILTASVPVVYAQEKCYTLEEVVSAYPDIFEGKESIDLQGQKLAAFATAYKQVTGQDMNPEITRLIFYKYSHDIWAVVIFVNGCVVQVAPFPAEAAQQLINFSSRFRVNTSINV